MELKSVTSCKKTTIRKLCQYGSKMLQPLVKITFVETLASDHELLKMLLRPLWRLLCSHHYFHPFDTNHIRSVKLLNKSKHNTEKSE